MAFYSPVGLRLHAGGRTTFMAVLPLWRQYAALASGCTEER
jgi:hypothetical protein